MAKKGVFINSRSAAATGFMKSEYFLCMFAAMLSVCMGCRPVETAQPGSQSNEQELPLRIRNAVGPDALKLAGWEINNLVSAGGKQATTDPGITRFSDLPGNISEVLSEEKIAVFPQVRVKLEAPPPLLVISRRERIVYYDRILLRPGLPDQAMAEIEDKVDALDLSSLVVQLGGFGAAYPAIVSPDMPAEHIVNAAVEEWAHQYLAFKPLGSLYLLDSLGLRQDPAVIVMNETLAGMIAREIGDKVYERYYSNAGGRVNSAGQAVFDFNKEMRETRLSADGLLAAGKIGEAEQYMKDRRLYFNQHGYAIRKLNQAYFAFHGIYGQDPGAVSPVYQDMLKLRKNCVNLSGFVDKISGMASYADLEKAAGSPAGQ